MSSKPITSARIATKYVAGLSADAMSTLVAGANDIVLIVDNAGIVLDVAAESGSNLLANASDWVGHLWIDSVTVESRLKIEALMRTSKLGSPSRWRHVNHPSQDGGPDIPMMYRAFGSGEDGYKIVMGRDLRPLSALQQQLIDVQQSMEREYARLYQAETRYRMLFQMASEAILIVDADGRNVLEANPAAAKVLGKSINKLVGNRFSACFSDNVFSEVTDLFAALRAAGTANELNVRTINGVEVRLSATLLRREDATLHLVHLRTVEDKKAGNIQQVENHAALDVIERSPDGFVVTDPEGRILTVNNAFLEMCQIGSEIQARNQPLDQWLGHPGVDVSVLRKNLQQRGSIRQFSTRVNPEFGTPVDVELSAVAALDADPPCLGFVIRHVMRRPEPTRDMASQPFGRSLEQMTELVGRVPMKDLVRETTDLIERLCIEAALKLTTNNRASAADMLGLSRQSLYVKLRRYGIGDGGALSDD